MYKYLNDALWKYTKLRKAIYFFRRVYYNMNDGSVQQFIRIGIGSVAFFTRYNRNACTGIAL